MKMTETWGEIQGKWNIVRGIGVLLYIQLSQKLCTQQSRKVIWDIINTLVLDSAAVEPTFVAFH